MNIREAIEEIIKEVNSGAIFDSHFVISQLIKKRSDVYLNFAKTLEPSESSTITLHQRIAKEIGKLVASKMIDRMDYKSYSENIHGNNSECQAWKKH